MYYFYYLIIKALSCIPFGVLYVLSDMMYYPLYYVVRYRRKIVRKNLTESFPDKSLGEIIAIEKKFYHYFVDLIFESCKLATISEEEIMRRMKFVNPEVLDNAFADGKSIVTFIGHYGNWEWLTSVGLWLKSDAQRVQVYHKLSNEAVDKLMLNLRERLGNVCVEMHKTARFVSSATTEGTQFLLALIADQTPRKKDAKYYLSFLNHTVPVILGPEKITKHYDLFPVFVNIKRLKRGYYEFNVSPMHENPTELPDYQLSDIYFKRLEEEILAQPECYLWSHNRFRLALNNQPVS